MTNILTLGEYPRYYKLEDNSYIGLIDIGINLRIGNNVTFALSSPSKPFYCYESDIGVDFFKNGRTCLGEYCIEDFCVDNKILNETYCSGKEIKSQLYTCDSGSCVA